LRFSAHKEVSDQPIYFGTQLQIFTIFLVYAELSTFGPLFSDFGFSDRPQFVGLIIVFEYLFQPINFVLGVLQTMLVRRSADTFFKSYTNICFFAGLSFRLMRLLPPWVPKK
jgi:hypothetical protein